jgi:hypothetical protein
MSDCCAINHAWIFLFAIGIALELYTQFKEQ